MKLTREEARKIAELAKLDLTDAELDKYAEEISSILDYVSQLSEVDVTDIPETSNLQDFQGATLRADEPKPAMLKQDITINATEGRAQGSSFKTSKIIGGEE